MFFESFVDELEKIAFWGRKAHTGIQNITTTMKGGKPSVTFHLEGGKTKSISNAQNLMPGQQVSGVKAKKVGDKWGLEFQTQAGPKTIANAQNLLAGAR